MLNKVRARPVCRAGRSDLCALYEHLFRSTSTLSPSPRRRAGNVSYNPGLGFRRQFSGSHASRKTDSARQDVSAEAPRDLRPDPAHNLSVSHDALVEMLETEMGMTLEEAIAQDETRVEAILQSLSVQDAPEITLEAVENPIAQLRESGASQAAVVREARIIFGDCLPKHTLDDEEMSIYRRLYGEPSVEDEEDRAQHEVYDDIGLQEPQQHVLYSARGDEIVYESQEQSTGDGLQGQQTFTTLRSQKDERISDGKHMNDFVSAQDIARSVSGDIIQHEDNDLEDEDDGAEDGTRHHPLTRLGKFATSPRTVLLSHEGYVRPVDQLMSDFSNKHLKEMCERLFGGPGLPDSPLTPRSGKFKQQVPIPLEANQHAMGEMEANAYITTVMPPSYASVMAVLAETRKRLGSSWLTRLLAKEGGPRVLDASAGGAGIIAWREVINAHWGAIHSSDRESPAPPPSKGVVVTGSDTLRHRAAAMLENTTFIPRLPDYVHTRDAPTLEDDRPAQQRKQFDVIIAPHSLFTLKEEWMRKQHVQNLWSLLSSEGGVLILIEKGIPRGFEAIAGAREMLLERHIAVPRGQTTHYSSVTEEDGLHKREAGMIVAPCTNHQRCPMYSISGTSRGRRDICSFQQRYIRPAHLQRVLGAKDRNHDDVDFSYLSVMKGDDLRNRDFSSWEDLTNPVAAPTHLNSSASVTPDSAWLEIVQTGFESSVPETDQSDANQGMILSSDVEKQSNLPALHRLPRIVYPPIKRKGHVTLDLCTPAGKIERWTIPRSFSKQAYRDARKSRWGDLWALGAKTRIARNLSLGISEKDVNSKSKGRGGDNKPLKGRNRNERLQIKAQKMLEAHEQERLDEAAEARELMHELDEEFDLDPSIPREDGESTPDHEKARTKASKQQRTTLGAQQARKPSSRDDDEQPGFSSDEEVSNILADWQQEFDQLESNSSHNKNKDKLGRREKQKMKKALRKVRADAAASDGFHT